MQYLDQAKQRAGPDLSELKEFEERLRYRLHSREIISAKQFKDRFPNGWKPEGST
jgi:hypothetical protein